MSYNRGMRRDSGRRSGDFGGGGGGGGGGRRSGGGNFRGNYDTYGNQMNPWEGGMVPGGSRGGGGGGGSGLLPAPGQSDLLSQLSTTEAQLALASNLINKIFNQQPTSNVPSLMSLGGLGPGGPGYSSDDYGRNYQERRRGRLDGGRRAEPYSKASALNRRLGERRFQNVGKNRNSSDRKAGASVGKSPKKDDKDNKKDKDAEKTNGEVDSSQADQSKREGEEGDKDKDESSEERKDKKNKDMRYQNIPPALLFCHVCSKNMWDESSFLKHLKGRLHQLMMDGLNEKYKLNVDLLRHEMRLAEQQREMELERKHRHGMKVYNHSREYCAMCDLHFYGNLISHRKNMRHQKLKAFLHPKCSHCNKEFSTRLEWDDHRLTSSHLMKVAEYRRATKPNLKDDEFDIDELIAPELVNCGEIISKDVQIVTQQQTEDDVVEAKETAEAKEGADEKDKEKEKAEGAEEAEKQAQTFRGIDVDPAKLPKYSASIPIGQDLVTNVEGFMCRACNCFMPGDWADTHCRTLTHYNNYCNLVRAKARVSARQKREDQAKEKSLKEKSSKDKSNASGDDEGNWKRRKVSKEGEEEEEDQEESVAEDGKEGDGNVTEEKMEVEEEVKDGDDSETKQEAPESAWEEIDKDIEASEVKNEEGEEENADGTNESEEVQAVATRGRKGTRGNAKGKAKRGK